MTKQRFPLVSENGDKKQTKEPAFKSQFQVPHTS